MGLDDGLGSRYGSSIMLQLFWALLLGSYVLSILWLSRLSYQWMVEREMEPIQAIYYNRKLIHIVAGGVVALVVPLVFNAPWIPLFIGLLITMLLWEGHHGNWQFEWFQTSDNRNDVKFSLMWTLSVTGLWWWSGDPWLAVLPALYMALGAGVSGIARTALVGEYNKDPVGNLFMLLVCLPIGLVIGLQAQPALPLWGMLSAMAATFVERFDFGPIDDNILIAVITSSTLVLGIWSGPLP